MLVFDHRLLFEIWTLEKSIIVLVAEKLLCSFSQGIKTRKEINGVQFFPCCTVLCDNVDSESN